LKFFRKNFRAFSRVLAVLLLVVVSLGVYMWTTGYFDFSTEKLGRAITVTTIEGEDSDLKVCVQNTGKDVVQLVEDNCLYVNGKLVDCTISGVNVSEGVATLGEEENAILTHVNGASVLDEKVEVKVAMLLGGFSEKVKHPTGSASTSSGSKMWSQTYGGTEDDVAYALVETSDGGYAIAGTTESFGVEYADFWLVKIDGSGHMEWSKTYGEIGNDIAYALVETSDGGFAIAGETEFELNRDFWLVKTDSSGNVEWNKKYGGTDFEGAASLVATADGGYALAGYTSSFGAGATDFWLVKTDSSGTVEWSKTYGGEYADFSQSLVETTDGGYALAGYTDSFGAGNSDCWLVKTDASGNMEWNRTYGGINHEWAYSLVETSDGGYALAGSTGYSGHVGTDFWLVKTDAFGDMEWNQTYDSTGYDNVESLVVTSDGGYAIAGYSKYYDYEEKSKAPNKVDYHPYIYEIFLIKTDICGNMQWNQTYGGTGWDWAYSLVATSDGGYALAGRTASRSGTYPNYIWNHDFCLVKTG
jgi:hypothetical protein